MTSVTLPRFAWVHRPGSTPRGRRPRLLGKSAASASGLPFTLRWSRIEWSTIEPDKPPDWEHSTHTEVPLVLPPLGRDPGACRLSAECLFRSWSGLAAGGSDRQRSVDLSRTRCLDSLSRFGGMRSDRATANARGAEFARSQLQPTKAQHEPAANSTRLATLRLRRGLRRHRCQRFPLASVSARALISRFERHGR